MQSHKNECKVTEWLLQQNHRLDSMGEIIEATIEKLKVIHKELNVVRRDF